MQTRTFTLTLSASPVTAGSCTLTATLMDGSFLEPSATVQFATNGSALFGNAQSTFTGTTDAQGRATATLSDTRTETVNITALAKVNGASVASAFTDVTFSSGAVSAYTRPHLREASGSGESVTLSTTGLGSTVSTDIPLSGNGPISANDRVILTWRATRAGSSSQETLTALTRDVSTGDINSGAISIPAPTATYVTPYSNGGSLELSYTVFDGTNAVQKGEPSAKEFVAVDAGASTLAAPSVPEATGDSIPANTATATLRIPPWAGMALEQLVTYDWVGTFAGGGTRTLTDNIQVTSFNVNQAIDFVLAPSQAVAPFDGGSVDVSYFVNGIGGSASHRYGVGAQQALPAPVVTSATGSTVPPGGDATVRVSYPGIKSGDRISLLWQPYGTGSVPGSAYTTPHDVSANEATSGAVTLTVPAAYVNPYEGGRVEVSYREMASNRQSATANYTIGTAAGAGTVTSFVVELPSNGGPVSGNGVAYYQALATVTDDRGAVVQGATVSFAGSMPGGGEGFSLSQGEDVTDAQGHARTEVRCSRPAEVIVLARCGTGDAGETLILNFEAVISGTTSTFTANPQTIVADNQDEALLTLTARSAEGAAMTGLASRLSFILTGGGAVTRVQETPAGSGIYTAALRAGSAGSITVVPHLDGQPVAGLSAEVTSVAEYATMSPLVNGYTFQANAGFPTTGFAQARFQLLINGSAANNGQYAWSVDQTWLTVDGAGNVTFIRKPAASEKTVSVIARPVSGTPYAYKLTLNDWYINNGSTLLNWSGANSWAQQQGGVLPTVQQVNGSTTHGNGVRGTVGGLWSEWGDLTRYSSDFGSKACWASEAAGSGNHYGVNLSNGYLAGGNDINIGYVVCRQGL